jgi:tRNA (guanine-N7-)-methyltransferase
MEIEVGSGKGLFLQRACQAQPLHVFLGIEVIGKYARFAAARVAQTGCTNVKVVHEDALEFFANRVPDRSFVAVHVYFPDPWWKKRHRRRRVMNERFLGNVQRTLVQGGRLHFWTDVEEYFDSTLTLIGQSCDLEGPFEVAAEPALFDLDYRTHFERRVRLNELPVYRAEFAKPTWTVQVTTDLAEATRQRTLHDDHS